MKNMSNDFLIESYLQAKEMNLNPHFIYLLEKEIRRRSLMHVLQLTS